MNFRRKKTIMNHGIKILGVLVLFALLGCSVANGDNTNTAAFVKAVIAGQDLYVIGKDNQLVITPLKNDKPIRILSPVQPCGSFFLSPCWDITNNSLYLTYASDSLTGQFSVKLLEIPIASMRPYDGQGEHRLRIPHIEHRVVQAIILEDAYIRSQFGTEYESAVADMHVASNGIVTIVVQQNKKLYISTFDLKDRKKDWKIESAPTDRTLSPFVAIRGERGVSVISQDGQTHRVSGKEVSMVKKKSNAGSQSGQVNVEADVQIMVVDKRKPDISCLRFGMKDRSIRFHGNGIERTAADTTAMNKISDALERAMSALSKSDTAQNRKTVREATIIEKEPIPDDNLTKWGPKLSTEELAAIDQPHVLDKNTTLPPASQFSTKRTAAATSAIAKALPDWEIVQSDRQPTVSIDGNDGYRLLLRKSRKEYIDPPQMMLPPDHPTMKKLKFVTRYSHIDLVVFPADKTIDADMKKKISWQDVEQEYFTKAVDMGQGMGLRWFGRTTIFYQEDLREKLGLKDGDDRLELLAAGLGIHDKGTCTINSVTPRLARAGDRAIPYIDRC